MPSDVDYEILNHSHDSVSDTITQIKLRADPDAVNRGTYLDPVIEMSPAAGWGEQFHVQVLCSLKRGQCGRIQVQASNDSTKVIDSQDTLVGRPISLLVDAVPGSAGSYFTDMYLHPILWNIDTTRAIESATPWWMKSLPNSWVTRIGGFRFETNPLNFYLPYRGNYPITVSADLFTYSPGVAVKAIKTITLTAKGPTLNSMGRNAVVGPPDLMWFPDSSRWFVGWGDPASPSAPATPGIHFTFSANNPDGVTGYVAGTQLVVGRRVKYGADSFTTNGVKWLDQCTLFAPASSNFAWEGDDFPLVELNGDSVTVHDVWTTYFMYRPPGENAGDSTSIWVPIGKVTWFWMYKAERIDTGNTHPYWQFKPGTADATGNNSGSPTQEFPEWPGVVGASVINKPCPSIPAP
jgi:hypothetical protein